MKNLLLRIAVKILQIFLYIMLILSVPFLGIGTFLMDVVLKTLGVEKNYLLSTDIKNWIEVISVYLKTYKTKPITNTGEKENV